MLYLFGADTRALAYTFHPIALHIGGLLLPTARLVALAAGLVLIGVLTWFLYRTLPGKALRAAIMNPGAIGIVGVDIARLSALAFGLAIGLAGVTGVLIALVFPAFDPSSGMDFTLIGFVVIVLGGLGHPVGAILGGVLYGLATQLATLALPESLSPVVGFAILIGTVMLRPAGLFGQAVQR
jgi:branched-chain amino acid transport system permease protein